tara:strand:+ start:496 stop:1002 length:507 start_codon:yes stop_codon:yes gene_type:complete
MFIRALLLLLVFSSFTYAKTLTWKQLRDYDPKENPTKKILSLHGKKIDIKGYIVPIEPGDSFDSVLEFLLVPDPLSCYHIPPPPPNQMIYVILSKSIPVDMDFRGLRVSGTFLVKETENDFYDALFTMKATDATSANFEIDDTDLYRQDYDKVHEGMQLDYDLNDVYD